MDKVVGRPAALAVADAAVAFAWYALPDVVRSRSVRGGVKTALLGSALAAHLTLGSAGDNPEPSSPPTGADPGSKPFAVVAGLALLGLSSVAAVRREQGIFARGERQRARGARTAHIRRGLVAGVLVGVVTWVGGLPLDAKAAGRWGAGRLTVRWSTLRPARHVTVSRCGARQGNRQGTSDAPAAR